MFLLYHKDSSAAYVHGKKDVIDFSTMTKIILTRTLILFVFAVVLLLAACAPQAPIAVYITPTPPASEIPASSVAPLVEPTEFSAGSSSGYTLTSIQVVNTVEPHPTVTWMGPVIGPGYTLPPTATPVPTNLPPTIEGQPSATPAPGQPTQTQPTQEPTQAPTIQGTPLFPDVLPDLDRTRMGFQTDSNLEQSDWDEVMRRLGSDQLNAGWVKIQVPWEDMQPNGPDDRSIFYQRTVLYLQQAQSQQHLKILISIAKAPSWARSTQDQDGPPDDPQTYANFITLLLGDLKGAVDAVEIWNEPNLSREWIGGLEFSGAGYMRLFDAGYRAVRAYSATLPVITAGLAPTGSNPGTVDDRIFLSQMYAAGLGNYHDIAIGIHPYGWANAPEATCCGTAGWDDDPHFFFADTIRDYRQLMEANGQSNLQLWATEFGWATWEGFPGQPPAGSEWMVRTSKWDQANWTIRAFQIGQQMPYMGPMFLWNLNFATLAGMIENNDERAAYSIVLPGANGRVDLSAGGLTERPLYWMLYDAVRPDLNLDKYD